jgi:transcriptional regulator with XRE-family HTH domain
MTGTSPSIRQRELGKRLQELRLQRNLTVEAVAENLLCPATRISRLETGSRRPSLRDIRDLGTHAAQDSNLVLLEFAGSFPGSIVFIEGLTANQYLERNSEVARYREAIEYLRDSALSPRDSISLMEDVRKAYAQ